MMNPLLGNWRKVIKLKVSVRLEPTEEASETLSEHNGKPMNPNSGWEA